MNAPLITIIIPVYNRAALIKETLQSVLDQSSSLWRCFVVDDGSSDGTVEVVTAFAKANSRIRLLQRDKEYASGGNGARQMGLDRVETPWVLFLDSDDLLAKDCIERRIETVEDSLDMILYHTGTFKQELGDHEVYWNLLKEGEIKESYLVRFLDQDMPWHTSGVLWNCEFIQKIGGWNEKLTAWQDWELHVRALTFAPNLKTLIGPADSYYRLEVENSIAAKKKSVAYCVAVQNAIQSIESRVLGTSPGLKRQLQYLIYRNLIANPIRWKRKDIPKQVLLAGATFQTVTKSQFILAYWKARFYEITIVKRFLKYTIRSLYYERLYPTTTFLKKPL